jgi:hypothetical protein
MNGLGSNLGSIADFGVRADAESLISINYLVP